MNGCSTPKCVSQVCVPSRKNRIEELHERGVGALNARFDVKGIAKPRRYSPEATESCGHGGGNFNRMEAYLLCSNDCLHSVSASIHPSGTLGNTTDPVGNCPLES